MVRLSPQGAAAVLVVEDEPLIMLDAVAIIEDAGFRTRQATNAQSAMAILEQDDDVQAVFTDIQIVGDPDGLRLAHMVRDRWPPVGLVITSGRVVPKDGEMPEHAVFLPKPYSPNNLLRALREIMH